MRKLFILILQFAITYSSYAQLQPNWKNTGPVKFPTNKSGQINGIGRCSQLKFHPFDSLKRYTASASGGLYYSADGGNNWNQMNTDVLPKTECASLAIHPTNDSIIYLGTGDANYYGGGLGVWKSIDHGATWISSNSGMGNVLVIEILINPSNPNVLIAATDAGIYKSINAGATWTKKNFATGFKDMMFKAVPLTDTIYAVNSSQFYISPDMGETWNLITNGVVIPGGGSGGGFRLGVSPANPQAVYIGMIKDEGTILRSLNGGTSFTTVYHNPSVSLTGYDENGGGQGNYNFDITVDPNNANVVYLVSHCVWRSDNGGIAWTRYTDWWDDCHTDMHHIVHNPFNTAELYNINDGAIFLSTDSGDNWVDKSDGIAATECYHAAQSPVSVYNSIGTQDNGECYFDGIWKTNRGGDWTVRMSYGYLFPNQVYYHDGERRLVNSSDQSWNIPFTPGNSGNDVALGFTPANVNTGYCGKTDIWVSTNLNNTSPAWTKVTTLNKAVKAIQVSETNENEVWAVLGTNQIVRVLNATSLTPQVSIKSVPASTTNSDIAIVKNHPNEVFVSCGFKIYFSSDTGSTWVDITLNLPVLNIRKIFHDNYSSNHALYVCNNLGVYFKNDTMTSWASYANGLPTVASYADFMMMNDGTPNSKIMASYYGRGVWESQMYKPNALPAAAFGATKKIICVNENVQFIDSSTTNVSSYLWTFTGGNPVNSTLQNPIVTYAAYGKYDVSLVVTNAFGTDTMLKTQYIKALSNGMLPFSEAFEVVFPPVDWQSTDVNANNGKWNKKSGSSAYGIGQACAFFNNFVYKENGNYDRLITQPVDLNSAQLGVLKFDVAYAANTNAAKSDTLAVYASIDCGSTYTLLYEKGSTTLATAPPNGAVTFIPTPAQWRTDSIDVSAYIGQQVLFAFENRGYNGQAIYLDNVNVNVFTAIEQSEKGELTIFPNPSSGNMLIDLGRSNRFVDYKIYSAEGKLIRQSTIANNVSEVRISESSLSPGLYTLQLSGNNVLRNFTFEIIK
ncbi:MAG: choice-of-anchor J domain-containing protein [Bacteroidetes bacterium]|nr:choice-of-anchor J domain-containing protein [Bacteroidota bacterium]